VSRNLLKDINEKSPWQDMTTGAAVYGGANSHDVKTGEWRTLTPIFHTELCKQCLLCFPVCPDSSIPVNDGKRLGFDYEHCKGCGICKAVCPFGAITYGEETEDESYE
jgi:pyruvate ferredoxin oxidoreductase delta subunit